MEYIGNKPNPPPTNPYPYDDYPWWNYNPYGNMGGYDPYAPQWTPPTPGQEGLQPVGGGQPDVDANGNPVFRTDVTDTAPPLETTGSDIGQLDPNLAEYLASLSGGGTPGSTGADFSVTGWDVGDLDTGDTGGTTPKFETTGWDVGDWGSPGGTSFQTGPMNSLVSPPSGGGGGFPVSLFPWLNQLPGIITGGGGGGGGQQQPQQPSQGQQGQKGSQTGNPLAALPLLAAFQGGTTTTPAPYAHLGPHTPVKPVFGPQAPGKPIPSIGQLLAGVK